MPNYDYIAIDTFGNKYTGSYNDIESVCLLRDELAKMGDTLVKAKRWKSRASKWHKIKQSEVVNFTYRLAGMTSAGISLIKSLETLEEQTTNESFRTVIIDIKEKIATGSSLTDAFSQHRKIFSDFYIGMLEAASSGGNLSQILQRCAEYLEKRGDLKHKLKSSFSYPVFVGLTCIIVVSALITFVVPVFSKLYSQMNVPLPGPTQALVFMSNGIKSYWWVILSCIILMILFLKVFSKSFQIKKKWDRFILFMPLFSRLNRMIIASHFIRTIGMLVATGVSIIKAIDVANRVVHNTRVSEICEQIKHSIASGNQLAHSMHKYEIFPPMIVQLTATGEQSGTLSDMLNKGADFLDKDIERSLKALLLKVEPAMTVIMGLIVGFILLSVYLPMFDYMRHLK
ncbi:MAG: type II secretion system F family protein [Planctomycetota bacterium]|jgi:type II secretory pathway component PulF